MQNKKARRINLIQNLAIGALSLTFLFLLGQTPLFGGFGADGLPSLVRGWLMERDLSPADDTGSLTTLSVPVSIVQANDFIRTGTDALTTSDSAFESVGSFFSEAIGSAYSISSVPESIFLSALAGSGIYLEFASALPLEVLSVRLGVTSPTSRQLDVRRCLLSVGAASGVQLYLQDGENNCYCFSTAVSASSLTEYLQAQEGESVEFAFLLGEEYSFLSPYTLSFASSASRRVLNGANALTDYPADALLRAVEFNPHTKDRYTESSGTVVYIEGQRKLYLHPDGRIVYSGGAVEGSALFAVTGADAAQPDRAEICSAARRLTGTLVQGRTGDAALFLNGVATDETGSTVVFDYMYDGTPILFADGTHAAEVRIENGFITSFTLRLRRYSAGEQDSLVLPLSLSRAIAQRYPDSELSVAYVDSYADTVNAGWIVDRS